MYKIVSFDIGNHAEAEKESYEGAEKTLNDLEKQGYEVVSSAWDDGGLQGRGASGLVVILNK